MADVAPHIRDAYPFSSRKNPANGIGRSYGSEKSGDLYRKDDRV